MLGHLSLLGIFEKRFCYYLSRLVFVACLILGVEHTITLICCQCEAVAVTMARARLWPATIQNPQLAFTFELLDWAEALLYECQVAVKDFLAALKFKCRHIVTKVDDDIYIHACLSEKYPCVTYIFSL